MLSEQSSGVWEPLDCLAQRHLVGSSVKVKELDGKNLSLLSDTSDFVAIQVADGGGHRARTGLGPASSLRSLALLSEGAGLLFVLLTDFVEPLHVLEEFRASLKGDEKLCLLAVATVVRGLHSDRLSFDFLERGIVVPDKTRTKGK
jgi:hypothetical protein